MQGLQSLDTPPMIRATHAIQAIEPPMSRILLTGATGYIASHTWLALQQAGFDVVGVDNFANSSARVLPRLARLGQHTPVFVEADVGDRAAMEQVFAAHAIDAVVHFAAHKAVGGSGGGGCEPIFWRASHRRSSWALRSRERT
jgi:nucleoside-diphosphate-sugar epimerase